MPTQNAHELTALLKRVSAGDKEAESRILSLAYSELHHIAAKRLRLERREHTLQPTALVNEVYVRLFGSASIEWQNRAHFFAIAAKQMRFILVDHARSKRKGVQAPLPLDEMIGNEASGLIIRADEDLVALDEGLRDFAAVDPRAAHGVELRFFGGLTQDEVAKVQGVDVATVKRDWIFAKSWLYKRLSNDSPSPKKS